MDLKDLCPECKKKIRNEQSSEFIGRVNELSQGMAHEAAIEQAREELKEEKE